MELVTLLDPLIVDRGPLESAFALPQASSPYAVALRFESGTTVAWVSEVDSVLLGDIAEVAQRPDWIGGPVPGEPDQSMAAVTDTEPWADLVGRHVVWAWVLTNNSGFTDGLQIEFVDRASRATTILQLMAEGGDFDVRLLVPRI